MKSQPGLTLGFANGVPGLIDDEPSLELWAPFLPIAPMFFNISSLQE